VTVAVTVAGAAAMTVTVDPAMTAVGAAAVTGTVADAAAIGAS